VKNTGNIKDEEEESDGKKSSERPAARHEKESESEHDYAEEEEAINVATPMTHAEGEKVSSYGEVSSQQSRVKFAGRTDSGSGNDEKSSG
jgi:hypothetical protein